MPNGPTHRQYTKVVAHLILRDGFAPGAARWLGEHLEQFVDASALPDSVCEVACDVPGEGPQTSVFGHNLSSLSHFEPGFRLKCDPSLSLAGPLADLATRLARMRVVAHDGGTVPPLAGLLDSTPMQCAVYAQPDRTLGGFLFPAASESAEYYARGARWWAGEQNGAGWRGCAGYCLHFVHDTCVPHHTWGMLLGGHQAWEDQLEAAWQETLTETTEASLVDQELAQAVRRELADVEGDTVADVCTGNADWARRHFGDPHELAKCPGDVALKVSVRAIAASVRAVELITGGCP